MEAGTLLLEEEEEIRDGHRFCLRRARSSSAVGGRGRGVIDVLAREEKVVSGGVATGCSVACAGSIGSGVRKGKEKQIETFFSLRGGMAL